MKYLQYIIVALLSVNIAYAEHTSVAALVDDVPITNYDLQNRKKVIILFNKIPHVDASIDRQITKNALDSLINDQLLFNYAQKMDIAVSNLEVDEAIDNIEQKNNMQKGYLIDLIKQNSIDVASFKAQIRAELIKSNILSSIAKSVTVSPKEISYIIFAGNAKDANVSVKIFSSNDNSPKSVQQMHKLQKRLKSKVHDCKDITEAIYKNFATITEIDQMLISKMPPAIGTILKDLDVNQVSEVFGHDNRFKLLMVCKKQFQNMTDQENNYVINFLSNKKMSQKAQKFFDDLRKKSYIKIYP